MDIDKIFKLPSIPSGKNKRKLTATPSTEVLINVRARLEDSDEDLDVSSSPTTSKNKGKGKSVQISDEVEEREYYVDDYGDEDEEGRFYGGGLTEEQKRILELVDEVETEEADVLDPAGVRKLILKFEKAITKNNEFRVKYADDPSKFMESEADLDEEIKRLKTLSEVPDLYPYVVQLGAVPQIVSLLAHENTDIAIDVVELLNELTDEDVVAEHEENAMKEFVNALLENQMLELLVQNLRRLDENESADNQGVFNTLGVVENLTSLDPSISERVVMETDLLQWILTRIKVKVFDSNRQYASEILAILLQDSRGNYQGLIRCLEEFLLFTANRIKLGELGGVDVLLQVLNSYKRKDPKDADETEMMENFFDCLCSALAESEIKQKFLEGEGIELMLIMAKEKMMARMRAMKVLDYAMSTPDGAGNCERFVEIFGLKTLFATFMRKGIKKLRKSYKNFSEAQEEEHVIGIIVSLIKNLPFNGDYRLRLLSKFIENDYEKVNRLLELRDSYEAKVAIVDREITRAKQLVDLALAWIASEDAKIKERATTLLGHVGRSFEDVKSVLQEYYENLGGDESVETMLTSSTPMAEEEGGKNDNDGNTETKLNTEYMDEDGKEEDEQQEGSSETGKGSSSSVRATERVVSKEFVSHLISSL
ncbi:6682_t:CDS:10 [Paraglomus brasilianum]|uniref:6682_t:CDS:1 n=1 Tax=Paraglomus brasilianum TaxID=144538 RepID=A0A9N9ASM6_9GLOM|nr:6682_t:CDS:10 [Paraglomus brasilianum]